MRHVAKLGRTQLSPRLALVRVANESDRVSVYRRRQTLFGHHVVDDVTSLLVPHQKSRDPFGVYQ